jgi:hypothetical protein
MSTVAEELVRRYSDEVINGQHIDQVDALFQPDVTFSRSFINCRRGRFSRPGSTWTC